MNNNRLFTSYTVLLVIGILSIALYAFFAYQLERANFNLLISFYAILFILYANLVWRSGFNFYRLLWLAVLFRLIFLLAIPNLSQDFFRFIWDGKLLLSGINPYLFTPDELMAPGELVIAQADTLVNGMGALSAGNHSNYPPLNQLLFAIATFLGGKSILGSVIIMRLMIIGAEIGSIILGARLLSRLGLNPNRIFWYALNPFIIIELTGNLHYEAVMIFFLIWALYLLQKKKWFWAALLLGCSISTKLIPLIFLPLLLHRLGWIKSFGFGLIAIGFNALLFIPFMASDLIEKYGQTVGLWFQKFEFNASLYYIAREIGYGFRGFNEIAIIGGNTPVIIIGFIGCLALIRNNKAMKALITAMLFTLSFYLFCSTTVHPWYIATLLALSIFTSYKYPILWSLLIMLSYSAYSNDSYAENFWLIGIEYGLVYLWMIYELFRYWQGKKVIAS